MNRNIVLILMLHFTLFAWSQVSYWQPVSESSLVTNEKVRRNSFPKDYRIYKLDLELFTQQLQNVPVRGETDVRSTHPIYLPNAQGKLEKFYVMETPIMEKELANRYPSIKSYAAQGVDTPGAVARFSVTPLGVHNMVFLPGKSPEYIDPYTEDLTYYIVYSKNALEKNENDQFECLLEDQISLPSIESSVSDPEIYFRTDDSTLRTYRIALSCTAEYGNIFAGTGTVAQQKARIQAQMAVTMTRVNGIYELDLGITMVFVANNDQIIFLGNVNNDPWTNEYNTQTAVTIDNIIGVANYDIGHNFNTTGGGNAGCLACVCRSVSQNNIHKGRGYTGRANPTGDAFDVDYVAHEIGHQFGGYHTQSNANCRSGSGQTEVEPGSASTIMGYAGICAANVQNQSDAYFAFVNIRDIMAYVKTTTGSCSVNTPFPNLPPTVSAGDDYTIPRSTPFILEAIGSDPDGDVLTYTWEQNDPQNANSNAAPVATRLQGPMFRSIWGTTSPKRYMPNKATVLNGLTANTWEVVPSVGRTLNFSVVARDNVAGSGQTATDEMRVTVSGTTGPFVVTTPNTNVDWPAGSQQTVVWNVAGTNANDVNCEFVDIYLSTDGGNNFSLLLASKVPNNGSALVTMPLLQSASCRVKVRGHNNIFYDVSNVNFRISAPQNNFLWSFDRQHGGQNKFVCQGDEINFQLLYETIGSFTGNVNFSAPNLPAGINVLFSPSTLNTTGLVQATVQVDASVAPNLYTIPVVATSGATTRTVNLYVIVRNAVFINLQLQQPSQLETGVSVNPTFRWAADAAASLYEFELATDALFTNIVHAISTTTNTLSVNNLQNSTVYYWRVKPKNESCSGAMSEINQFITGLTSCDTMAQLQPNWTMPGNQAYYVDMPLVVTEDVIVDDLSVEVNLNHTYVGDLTLRLIHPNGTTSVVLLNMSCASADNINATFSDSGVALVCGTNPAISGLVLPLNSLQDFVGLSSLGTWTLRITDNYNGDGGLVNRIALNICSSQPNEMPCGFLTTTWTGTSWTNGVPQDQVMAIVNADLNVSQNLDMCRLLVNEGASVVVQSGVTITVTNEVQVATGADLVLQNNASLVQINNSSMNSGTHQMLRDTQIRRLDYVYWSSPVTSYNLHQISPNTPDQLFWQWNPTQSGGAGVWEVAQGQMQLGKGYIVRGPSGWSENTPQTYTATFAGTFVNGNIQVPTQRGSIRNGDEYVTSFGVPVTAADDNLNLVGNPYPSAIDALQFLQLNPHLEGNVRIWTHGALPASEVVDPFHGDYEMNYTLNDYIVFNAAGASVPQGFNGFIGAGQGFFVTMQDGAAATIPTVFNNELRRAGNNDQFYREEDSITRYDEGKLWLTLKQNQQRKSSMMLGYFAAATDEADLYYDAATIGSNGQPKLYTLLDGNPYTIQGKASPFSVEDRIPLGLQLEETAWYSIHLEEVLGVMESQLVYLIDYELGVTHNLSESPYEFLISEGQNHDRFEIVFKQQTMGLEVLTATTMQIYAHDDTLYVRSHDDDIDSVALYDLLGRIIDLTSTVDAKDWQKKVLVSDGVYVVNVRTQSGKIYSVRVRL